MIDAEIKRHFDILKKHGYVSIYDDDLVEKFKQFLDYINFRYCLNKDRDYNCPERNRFEIEK